MTPEYRVRRNAKHAAQAAAKVLPEMFPVDFTIDLTPKTPHLAFLNGKTFKQGNGGRKNASGHRTEQIAANDDNKNPYLGADGKWFWMDDEGVPNDQSYVTREQAEIALADYREWLRTAEPMSIGGISENLAIFGDNTGEVSN
jgi:hypothetical protein